MYHLSKGPWHRNTWNVEGITSIFLFFGKLFTKEGVANEARDMKCLAHVGEIGCFIDLKI